MNMDLKKAMLVFAGVSYDQFVAPAARINASLMKARKERQGKDGKTAVISDLTSSMVSKGKSGELQQSSGARHCEVVPYFLIENEFLFLWEVQTPLYNTLRSPNRTSIQRHPLPSIAIHRHPSPSHNIQHLLCAGDYR